jgi:hypothetical protein
MQEWRLQENPASIVDEVVKKRWSWASFEGFISEFCGVVEIWVAVSLVGLRLEDFGTFEDPALNNDAKSSLLKLLVKQIMICRCGAARKGITTRGIKGTL